MMSEQTHVYLDYAATAPLCEEAAHAMEPFMAFGAQNISVGANPNSVHTPGRDAFKLFEDARDSIASDIGAARSDEIIFTSGATESDNAAVLGLAFAARESFLKQHRGGSQPHIITSAIEHEAVLSPFKRLSGLGFHVSYIKPDEKGFISPDALLAELDDTTVFVSIQMANAEIGTIEPISQLSSLCRERGVLFHTDATQALGKTNVDLNTLCLDAASFSSHKVGGPKGVGFLYLRSYTPFSPLLLGGGQEFGKRSGTQNVMGALGCAAAVHASCAMLDIESCRLRKIRDYLYQKLTSFPEIDATVLVEPCSEAFLPNVVHVLVDGMESETLVLRFDMSGFAVSGGSACSSHSLEPSHVLKSIGISNDRALGALRVSFGRYTTQDDIDSFLSCVDQVIHWV